jgi:hypothetical protein
MNKEFNEQYSLATRLDFVRHIFCLYFKQIKRTQTHQFTPSFWLLSGRISDLNLHLDTNKADNGDSGQQFRNLAYQAA